MRRTDAQLAERYAFLLHAGEQPDRELLRRLDTYLTDTGAAEAWHRARGLCVMGLGELEDMFLQSVIDETQSANLAWLALISVKHFARTG